MDENKTFGYGADAPETVLDEVSQEPKAEQNEEQTYSYGQSQYDNYGQNYNQSYGQANYGMGAMLMDEMGRPLKNNTTLQMVFGILEMLCCCCCGIITSIMGIVSIVFASKANTAYTTGNASEYKSASKKATIFLWGGFAAMIVTVIIAVVVFVLAGVDEIITQSLEEEFLYDEMYDYSYEDDYSYDNSDTDEDKTKVSDDTDVSEQQDVVIGEGFVDPTITVNGYTVTFPLTYPEFVEAGFYIDSENEEYIINKNEYGSYVLYTADGTDVGHAYIGNATDEPMETRDGIVFGIAVSSYAINYDGVTFSLPSGVNQNSDAEEFIAVLGAADSEYSSESYDHQSYTWYTHSAEYYDTGENSFYISYWDGKLDNIEMKYIGWD